MTKRIKKAIVKTSDKARGKIYDAWIVEQDVNVKELLDLAFNVYDLAKGTGDMGDILGQCREISEGIDNDYQDQSGKIDDLEGDIIDLKKELETAKEDVVTAKGEIEDADNVINNLNREIEEKDEYIIELEDKIKELAEAIDELNDKVS